MNYVQRKEQTRVTNKIQQVGMPINDVICVAFNYTEKDLDWIRKNYAPVDEIDTVVKVKKPRKRKFPYKKPENRVENSRYQKRMADVVRIIDEYTPDGTTKGTDYTLSGIAEDLNIQGFTQLNGKPFTRYAVAAVVNRVR